MKLATTFSGEFAVDGGIPPYCYASFHRWVDAMNIELSGHVPFKDAIVRTQPTYAAYRRERDIAEFLFFNPNGVLRATNPAPAAYLSAWLLGTKAAALPVRQVARVLVTERRGALQDALLGAALEGDKVAALRRRAAEVVLQAPWALVFRRGGCRERECGRDCQTAEQNHLHG